MRWDMRHTCLVGIMHACELLYDVPNGGEMMLCRGLCADLQGGGNDKTNSMCWRDA